RREERVVGNRELDADEERLKAADHQEEERRGPVEDADALVVHGREPAHEARLCGRAPEHERLRRGLLLGDEIGLCQCFHVADYLRLLRYETRASSSSGVSLMLL